MSRNRLGGWVDVRFDLEEAVARVCAIEAMGYESAWLSQVNGIDAMIAATAYARATSRIHVGTAVMPVLPRHPVTMAMEAASVDAAAGGRFRLGLGVSHRATMEGMFGLALDGPAALMREYLDVVRPLLRDGSAHHHGDRYQVNFAFMSFTPRPGIPILVAALSPRLLRLAGQMADGVILWLCDPEHIASSILPQLRDARESVGLPIDGFEVVAAVPAALSRNASASRDALRREMRIYGNLPFYRSMLDRSGFSEDLRRFDVEGPSGISDAMIDRLGGFGPADAVRGAVERYRQAGVTVPAVYPLPDHDGFLGDVETFGAAIGD
ncbi:MAG: LLM class flavin-dependent oxidoreductase [Candidatus Dormibacteria bacterium]